MKRIIALIALLFVFGNSVAAFTDRVFASSEVDGVYSYLLIGFDEQGENTDAIVVMSYNSSTNGLSVIQIPRDTYYRSANSYKINRLYAGYLKEGCDKETGLLKLTESLSDTFGIPIRGYAAFTLDAFKAIIDAVGGVNIELSEELAADFNRIDMGMEFLPGGNLLRGEQALHFVRFRSGYALSDITRLDAQKIFLRAMISSVHKSMRPSTVFKLIGCCGDGLSTNIGVGEILKIMVKNHGRIKNIKYSFLTVPGATVQSTEGVWYYSVNKNASVKTLGSLGIYMGAFDEELRLLNLSNQGFKDIYYSDDIDPVIRGDEELGDIKLR